MNMIVFGYTDNGYIRAQFDGVEVFVPDDSDNRERQAIAEWELEGNAIPPFKITLSSLKSTLLARIDREAEECRLRYITAGAGQAMTYQRKVEEAKTASLERNPIPYDYPMLSASLGIDGDSINDVASLVLDMDAKWSIKGSAIERIRQTAKDGVNRAGTEDDARIAASVFWP